MIKNNTRIAVIVPTLLFKIDQEICSPAIRVLENYGMEGIVVAGGYFAAPGDADEPGVWIYEHARSLDVQGFLLYAGGLGYASGPQRLRQFIARLSPHPTVSIGMLFSEVPSILADNYTGMHDLTQGILANWKQVLGDRQCGFILGPQDNQEALHRYQGWSDAIREAGMDLSQQRVVQGDFTGPGGQRATDYLLAGDHPVPRLIFCANDLTAFGVITRIKEAGFRVPEDVAVAGFDDFEYAGAFEGGLTSVHYPAAAMGELGATVLIKALRGEPWEAVQVAASHPVYRGSMPLSPGGYNASEGTDVESLRAMLQEEISVRDMQHSRILVDQLFFKQDSFESLFSQAGQLLDQSGVKRLWCCKMTHSPNRTDFIEQLKLQDTSSVQNPFYLSEVVSVSDYQRYSAGERRIEPGRLLPEDEITTDGRNTMLVHVPLGFNHEIYGYLVCLTDARVMGIPETLALQVSGVMKRLLMVEEALERQKILESTQEQLDRAERIAGLGRLVAGISHELNTPIGSGITLASFLADRVQEITGLLVQRRLSKTELTEFLTQANDAAQGMTESLNRIVTLMENFKSLSGDVINQLKRNFSLQGIIENSIIRAIAPYRSRVDLNMSCPEGLTMYGDPEVFDAIIGRLVSNSIEHGYGLDQRVRILVSLRRAQAGRLVFRYRDYGRGLSSEELQGIFEPFYTTRRGRGNTGLGMFIVHTLVTQALKGSIRIDSQPAGGPGVLVTIYFPEQGSLVDSALPTMSYLTREG